MVFARDISQSVVEQLAKSGFVVIESVADEIEDGNPIKQLLLDNGIETVLDLESRGEGTDYEIHSQDKSRQIVRIYNRSEARPKYFELEISQIGYLKGFLGPTSFDYLADQRKGGRYVRYI